MLAIIQFDSMLKGKKGKFTFIITLVYPYAVGSK